VSIALYGYGFTPTGGTIHPIGTVFVDGFEVALEPELEVLLDDGAIEGILNEDAMRFLVELEPAIECEVNSEIEIQLEEGIDCG
jgi:hypothetical protein